MYTDVLIRSNHKKILTCLTFPCIISGTLIIVFVLYSNLLIVLSNNIISGTTATKKSTGSQSRTEFKGEKKHQMQYQY